MLSRRRLLQTAGALAAMAAGGGAVCGYTIYIEPHWVETVHRVLPVRTLPSTLEGRRLVQLSDIHVGRRVADRYVLDVFDHVRTLEPDIVAITGDFVSHHPTIVDQAARIYRHLPKGRLATVGILGNHDYGSHSTNVRLASELQAIFEVAGLITLANAAIDVEGLRLIGLDDYWGPHFEPAPIMAAVEKGEPAIVLSHNPDTCDLPFWGAFDGWILAGHTHGGQCKPPFLPPPLLPVANKRYVAGSYALSDDRMLYINRGIGHLIQARFNVRPEITVFELTRASLLT